MDNKSRGVREKGEKCVWLHYLWKSKKGLRKEVGVFFSPVASCQNEIKTLKRIFGEVSILSVACSIVTIT